MPGSNCSIYGCNTNRRHKGIGLFGIPSGKDEYHTIWRERMISVITRDRIIDESLQKQIDNRTLHICQKHYKEDQICYYDTKTTLLPGSLPTLNLPKKSGIYLVNHRGLKRRPIEQFNSGESSRNDLADNIKPFLPKKPEPVKPLEDCLSYACLDEFHDHILKCKRIEGWRVDKNQAFVLVSKVDDTYDSLKYEIYVDDSLSFTVRVYKWLLPDVHPCYVKYKRSLKNITLFALMAVLENYALCSGICENVDLRSADVMLHCLPKKFDLFSDLSQVRNQAVYTRSISCELLTMKTQCRECNALESKERKSLKRKNNNLLLPAKLHAPITKTSGERVRLTLQGLRKENKHLRCENERMTNVTQQQQKVLIDAKSKEDPLKEAINSLPPFMKLFWQEQYRNLSNVNQLTSSRYHEDILSYFCDMEEKWRTAYHMLRYNQKSKTGFLFLPSRRVLSGFRRKKSTQENFSDDVNSKSREVKANCIEGSIRKQNTPITTVVKGTVVKESDIINRVCDSASVLQSAEICLNRIREAGVSEKDIVNKTSDTVDFHITKKINESDMELE